LATEKKKPPIIEVENLSKIYGTEDTQNKALDNVSLKIYSGEYVVFFGPSGCGKSTFLNCIAGIEIPSSGKVIIRGEDISKFSRKELAKYRNKKIGIIFQSFNVLKSFNVIENIALPQIFNGTSKKIRTKRAEHLLSMFGLSTLGKRIPTELSGGQQQRVAIARALVNNPWILIADEPTGNLDSKSSQEVMDLLEKLNSKSKRTVILVTHNPDHLKFANRVIHLADGKITKEETKKEVHEVNVDEIGEVTL
jgi:putative ABC transport system ATP-binding protein